MQIIRYVIAVLIVIAIPTAIIYWLLIHPFARFWRRIGAKATYAALLPVIAVIMAGMFQLRGRLLADNYGTCWLLVLPGLILLLFSGWLKIRLSRQLTTRILVGIPELSKEGPGKLLTEGIYARIRHPRYSQMTIALTGFALIANYPAGYWMLLCWGAGIYLVTLLEERELTERFGDAYRDYCRQVPRFVPRWRK